MVQISKSLVAVIIVVMKRFNLHDAGNADNHLFRKLGFHRSFLHPFTTEYTAD